MIDDYSMALMLSVAYSTPYVKADEASVLSNKEVFELIDMYTDEVKEYIRLKGVKTISLSDLQEDAYILCDNILYHIGTFKGMYIPSQNLFGYRIRYRNLCNKTAMLHTHPVPLPIPTPEDMISMQQMDYDLECVLSRIDRSIAKMVCLQPISEFNDIMLSYETISNSIYKLIDRYIVVADRSEIVFLPYPSQKSLQMIEEEFIKNIRGCARVSIALFNMENNEYDYYHIP